MQPCDGWFNFLWNFGWTSRKRDCWYVGCRSRWPLCWWIGTWRLWLSICWLWLWWSGIRSWFTIAVPKAAIGHGFAEALLWKMIKSIKCFSLNHYLPILILKNRSTVGEEEFAWKSPLYWCPNNLNLGRFPWHQICNLLVDGIIVGQGESLAGGGVEDSVNVVEHLGPSCRVLDWFLIKYFHGLHKPLWPSSARAFRIARQSLMGYRALSLTSLPMSGTHCSCSAGVIFLDTAAAISSELVVHWYVFRIGSPLLLQAP